MVDFLRAEGRVSDRRARLCVVAWARSFHHHAARLSGPAPLLSWLAGPEWLPQLEAAEAYADGQIDREGLRTARQKTGGPYNLYMVAAGISHFSLDQSVRKLQSLKSEFGAPPKGELCDHLRCIFGNPFRPAPAIVPAWLTWRDCTVQKLAQTAYDEHRSSAGTLNKALLAILADALEEAGCTDPDILNHLSGPGPHVRGCWVVDALLGKE